MGDDERFDYFYKFVSSKRMKQGDTRAAREHNLTLLDEGTLYVAKLTGDSPAAEIDGTGKLPGRRRVRRQRRVDPAGHRDARRRLARRRA